MQQNSDITYRLYDYGRPRELHLDEGVSLSLGTVYDLSRWHKRLPAISTVRLVDGPYFRMDRVEGIPDRTVSQSYGDSPLLVVSLANGVTVGGIEIAPGNCGLASSIDTIHYASDSVTLLVQPIDSPY